MKDSLTGLIESLIFISLEPLTPDKIKDTLSEVPPEEVDRALEELLRLYSENDRGIQIVRSAGGYVFATKSDFDLYVRRLLRNERRNRLSPAALETLSVVAYHQPITLAEINAVRSVDASHSLKTLLVKRLVKITGRKKAPGKPLIYRTTDKFLTHFGLNDIKELPSEEEISKILDEDDGVVEV